MSTPLQFAREQCANFDNGGSCKGIGIRDDGSLYIFGKKPACVLSNQQRCQYFEECVLPMGAETNTASGVIFARHLAEVRRLYSRMVPGFQKNPGRKCAACNRREVEKHKRLCYECAEKRKRASKAESQRRRRDEEKTHHKSLENIGQNGGDNSDSISG